MDRRSFLKLGPLPAVAPLRLSTPDGTEYDVSVLRLKPGDVIVLQVSGDITKERAELLKSQMERAVPNCKSIVLAAGLTISGLLRAD